LIGSPKLTATWPKRCLSAPMTLKMSKIDSFFLLAPRSSPVGAAFQHALVADVHRTNTIGANERKLRRVIASIPVACCMRPVRERRLRRSTPPGNPW
jgi:hypothetical protein